MNGWVFIIIFLSVVALICLVVYFFCSYIKIFCTRVDGGRDFVGVMWKSSNKYILYNDFPPFARKIGFVDLQGAINIDKENSQHNYVSTPCGSFDEQGNVFDINGRAVAQCLSLDSRSSSVVDSGNNNIEVAYIKSGFNKGADMMCRAAAFGALMHELKEGEIESKSDVRIGFKDLALPSTLIFLLLYVPFGIMAKSYNWLPFLGSEISYVCWMLFAYFSVCLILFLIKSHYTMRNKSLSFFTGLINWNVGVKGWNILIIVLSAVGIFTSSTIADYTIIPVFISILLGFTVNLGCYNTQWSIVEPISSWGKKWQSRASKCVLPSATTATGVTNLEFDWSPILKAKGIKQIDAENDKVVISINVSDLSRIRNSNPFKNCANGVAPSEFTDFVKSVLKGSDSASVSDERIALEQVIHSAVGLCVKYSLADFELYDLILQFCQDESIVKYVTDDKSDKIGNIGEYFRFPLETLYDREGDCDCKSVLAYKMFELLNASPRLAIVKFGKDSQYDHAAVVLDKVSNAQVKIPSTYRTYDDNFKYVYCEVTSKGYHPGDIPDEVDIKSVQLI